MKGRIETLLRTEQISSSRFADEIGVQRSSISHILSDRNKPSLDFIQKILTRYTNINAEWLLNGRGPMYKSSDSSHTGSLFNASATEQHTNALEEEKQAEYRNISVVKEDVFPETAPKLEKTTEKSIEKIVVFFADGTFKEYKSS